MPTFLVHLESDDARSGHGDQIGVAGGADLVEIVGRNRGDEIDVTGKQRRDAGLLVLDRRQHDAIDVARRTLVPVVGEAFEHDLDALLTRDHLERSGAGQVGGSERSAVLDDGALVVAVGIGAGVKLAVQREDVGRRVQHQRVRSGGDQVDGVVVNHIQRGEVGENTLEVRAFLEAVEGPLEIVCGHRVAAVELDALAQTETHRGGIEALKAGRQTWFERQFLGPANQWVERHVRQLQYTTRQLLVNIEGNRVGVVRHAQIFCACRGDG